MLLPDPSNTLFQLAAAFVNNTNRHVFLTGKAGTGKTTFLKHIQQQTHKNAVVVAPTGVAAIHAGGVTIHSFFQLPLAPFVPVRDYGAGRQENRRVFGMHSMLASMRMHKEKRKLLEALDLLIIDEVSMVRCDVLDAMDTVLRHFRRRPHEPFGGVQVLYIGDLFQLPPVVPPDQWQILQEHYAGPFFFDAHAVRQAFPLYIELKKIYRQKEQRFIDILNGIRNNQPRPEDLEVLNARYDPAYEADTPEKPIVLTTHNYKADRINKDELDRLPGRLWQFEGRIEGDFSDYALPADKILSVKEGAQVMFLRNDPEKRYYNGKLGKIKTIHDDAIIIYFADEDREMMLEKESWQNIRYTYNPGTGKIDEETTGSFTQYPIRLAWAVTIHKSQGLTFEEVVIDAGASFAPGQVYVALSRCTSLEGIVLRSRIHYAAIQTDEQVIAFAEKEAAAEELEQMLPGEQLLFLEKSLAAHFNLENILENIRQLIAAMSEKRMPDRQEAEDILKKLYDATQKHQEVTVKFAQHIHSVLTQTKETGDPQLLKERVSAAVTYFSEAIEKDVLRPLKEHRIRFDSKKKVRNYIKEVTGLERTIRQWIKRLPHAVELCGLEFGVRSF